MNQKKVIDLISQFCGQPNILTIPRILIDIAGDINSALLLSQLLYWTPKSKNNGWVYKTYNNWKDEIGLSEYQIKKAVSNLKKKKVLETKLKKANGKPTVHYRLDSLGTNEWILKELTNPITKTTTKTTTNEITSVISPTKLENVEEIFNYYLKVAYKIKNYLKSNNIKSNNKLTIHQNIHSKCTVSLPDNKDNAKSIPIIDIISEFLDAYSVNEFKTAIDNYYTVYISNIKGEKVYWYKVVWKNIGSFIYSGVHRNTGFKSLLDLNKLKIHSSEIDQLRLEFKPISKKYSFGNIFDTERQTYYGFDVDKLRNQSLMWEYEEDVRENYNNGTFKWGYFCFLEELIASIFLNRKSGYDMELLKALMSIWRETKPDYKKTALELR